MDTAGQERFDSQNNTYLKNANCVVIVYDISQPKTFDAVEKNHQPRIEEYCTCDPYIILVGNKYDLIDNENSVKEEDAVELAKKYNWGFSMVSAKTNHQISTLFQACANYSAHKGSFVRIDEQNNNNVNVNQTATKSNSIIIKMVNVIVRLTF